MRDLKGKPWNGIEIQVLRGKSIEQSLSYVGHDFICGLSLMDTSPLAAMCVCEGIAGMPSQGCLMLDNTVWGSQTWLPKWVHCVTSLFRACVTRNRRHVLGVRVIVATH